MKDWCEYCGITRQELRHNYQQSMHIVSLPLKIELVHSDYDLKPKLISMCTFCIRDMENEIKLADKRKLYDEHEYFHSLH